jgi:hypothetical protein
VVVESCVISITRYGLMECVVAGVAVTRRVSGLIEEGPEVGEAEGREVGGVGVERTNVEVEQKEVEAAQGVDTVETANAQSARQRSH